MERHEAQAMQADLTVAIDAVMQKYGYDAMPIRLKYGVGEVRFSCVGNDPDSTAMTDNQGLIGIDADVKKGQKFTHSGTAYIYTGVALNRPKYPISATRAASGKAYKLGRDAAKSINASRLTLGNVEPAVMRATY